MISDPGLKGWSGFGLAVQAYQKRAMPTLHWLIVLAESLQCQIPMRLVKGAYWDSEIKRAQVNGLEDYPVFTQKSVTDVSYLACAKLILSNSKALYPIQTIVKQCNVGNIYINRNMISAVVGVQPFGGMGLSGTGPKAGGPNYLQRFVSEQTLTANTAAIGGNVSLLAPEADSNV